MHIRCLSFLALCIATIGCSSSTTTPTTDCVPGEPVAQTDPCSSCICTTEGSLDCTPLEVGATCISDDCCMADATCQACEGSDCPSSGLTCSGQITLPCTGSDGCTLSAPQCVNDTCECADSSLPDDTSCIADANNCTTGDSCLEGECIAGDPADLEDGNPCTVGVCVKGVVEQSHLDGSCSDGNPCTLGDRCVLGQCLPDSLVECAHEPCGQGVCNPDAGACTYEDIADGSPCVEDGECGGLGSCTQGECVVEGDSCDDNNPCTIDSCDTDGCVHSNAADDTSCSNTAACVTEGVCLAGACVADGQDPCIVDDPCKVALCGPEGNCDTENAADDTLCSIESPCGIMAGLCIGGSCEPTAIPCNDNNPCTLDSCSASGCLNESTNEGGLCGNENPCDGTETCQQGFCQAGPAPECESESECLIGSCDPDQGCVYMADPDCEIGSLEPGTTMFFGGPDQISGLIPSNITEAEVHVWGAGGGGGFPGTGGGGAYVAATFTVAPGDTLELRVAGPSLSTGGGGGASYIYQNNALLLVAAGGGGGGLDGCSGCSGDILVGHGGAGGPAGGIGQDGTINNHWSTGSGGGSGGTQSAGGLGGIITDNSPFTDNTSCPGNPGAANQGGAGSQATNNNPCQSNFAPATNEAGSANPPNGVGGGGGAGYYGGGAGGGKWTYTGGGGGGGSSFAANSLTLIGSEGGQGPVPGGTSNEHYTNQAGTGGPQAAGNALDPQALGVSGMIVLILSP